MDNNERIDIAKDYVAVHKDNDVSRWQPLVLYGNAKYLVIYKQLINGLYRQVTCVDQVLSDSGDILHHGMEYQVEISAIDTRSQKSVVFWWYDDAFSHTSL
jgi:hypothetical protein